MTIKRLAEERISLIKQIDNLQSELKGLDRAIRLVSGETDTTETALIAVKPRARNVKETILTLVAAASPAGASVNDLMDEARMKGVALEKASVSSLLSRLKKEGVLQMDNGKYFVPGSSAGAH